LFDFYVGRHPDNIAYYIGGERNWDTFDPVRTYRNVRISSVWPETFEKLAGFQIL